MSSTMRFLQFNLIAFTDAAETFKEKKGNKTIRIYQSALEECKAMEQNVKIIKML